MRSATAPTAAPSYAASSPWGTAWTWRWSPRGLRQSSSSASWRTTDATRCRATSSAARWTEPTPRSCCEISPWLAHGTTAGPGWYQRRRSSRRALWRADARRSRWSDGLGATFLGSLAASLQNQGERLPQRRSAQDQHHRDDDHRAARQHPGRYPLAQEPPAEQDRDPRVDVGVGAGDRGPGVPEEPDVSAERQQRAEYHQVGQGHQGLPGHALEVDSAELPGENREQQQRAPTGEHLHPGRDHRPPRQRGTPGVHRSRRPGDGGAQDHERAEKVATSGGLYQQANPDDPQDQPHGDRPAEPIVAGEMCEQHHPKRHAGNQQGCDTGGDELLAPGHTAIPAGEQQHADDRSRHPLAAPRAVAGGVATPHRPCEEKRARDGETRRGHQQRWDGVDRDADAEVGGSPNQVQRSQGGEQEQQPGLKRRRFWSRAGRTSVGFGRPRRGPALAGPAGAASDQPTSFGGLLDISLALGAPFLHLVVSQFLPSTIGISVTRV